MPAEPNPAPRDYNTIMVSRSFSDWGDYRAALIKTIESVGLKPAALGHYELTAGGAIEGSLKLLQSSGALALIVGEEYGPVPSDRRSNPRQLSFAELEFDEAVRLKKPVMAFMTPDQSALVKGRSSTDSSSKRLQSFRSKLRKNQPVYVFETLADFKTLATRALHALAEQPLKRVEKSSAAKPKSRRDDESDAAALTKTPSSSRDAAKSGSEPKSQSVASEAMKVTASSLNVRSEPAPQSKIIAKLAKDHEVRAVTGEPVNGFLEIETEVAGDYLRGFAAVSFLTLTGSEQESAPVIDEFVLASHKDLEWSPNAERVWNEAQRLASVTGRGRVTSSCLLFGFAEAATADERNCAWFVNNLLRKTGKYDTAFKTFFEEGSEELVDHSPDVKGIDEAQSSTSRNVAAVLEYAKEVAWTISPDSNVIHQRHLLVALLNLPGRKGKLKAHKRMKEMGIERSQYIAEFFDFIRSVVPKEEASWRRLLDLKPESSDQPAKTSSPFVAGTAGYTAEFCGLGGERTVADYLFVSAHADRLAELIALKETKLPLAIGLFGNWGSGKSHFMNLIDRRLKALMKEERKRPENARPKWCREIVPIYFNAWHYLDSNLWASLVAQIFESLFAHLRPKEDDLAAVQSLLEEASGATARAAEEVGLAQAATEQAKVDLSIAEENRRREQTAVDALLHGLKKLLPYISSDELQQQVADVLGDKRAVTTLNDLKEVSKDARTLGSRVERSWNNLFKQPGRAWRITWLVVTLLIIPGLGLLAAIYLPAVKNWLGGFAGIAPVIAALPPVIGWIAYILKKGNEQLDRIDRWITQARNAQELASETPEVMEVRLNVTAAVAREEAARSRLAQAEAREQQLVDEARGLHPERRLGRYIEQRAQSADYRNQLGLVSLARRDFQELSNLFADAEALEQKVAGMHREQSETEQRAAQLRESIAGKDEKEAQEIERQAGELDRQAQDLEAQGSRVERLSASIDRIVLFVDDLDRCQPGKIVEILQAVHLLLAFPLFAVVVGVDQRALRQSLRMQFKGLLSQDGEDAQTDEARRRSQDPAERAATPLDYLEKIFHVPFHLPVMGKDGFHELINNLTEPPKTDVNGDLSESKTVDYQGQTSVLESQPKPREQSVPAPFASEIPGEVSPTIPATTLQPVKVEPIVPLPEVVQRGEAELMGSVPLQNWEREALRDYHTLIQTPRGAKRLLNTYRLVRAGVPKQDWDSFSAGEYRVAMLLLAAAAGYPATAREWFAKVMKPGAETTLADDDAGDASPGWNDFKKLYRENLAVTVDQLNTDVLAKWIDRVETFTF